MALDFAHTETRKIIHASARSFFERVSSTEAVRKLEASDHGHDTESWAAMAELGWLGIGIPRELGGSEGTFLDMLPIYEEMGRHLAPNLHLEVVAIAAAAILRIGTAAQQRRLLPAIARGEMLVVPTVMTAEGSVGACPAATYATEPSGYRLNGRRILVPYAGSADRLLWLASPGDAAQTGTLSAFLVDTGDPGVSIQRLPNLARQPLYEVRLEDVVVDRDDRLGTVEDAGPLLADVVLEAAVLQNACIVGAGRRVLEMTVDYAKERHQFGQAIGRFQAVQYLITDMLIDLHRADRLTRQAAYRIDRGIPYRREAAMAVAFTKQAAARIHRKAHEVFAGIAFIEDHDLPLFSRRSKYWENHLGDAGFFENLVAAEMGLNSESAIQTEGSP